MKCPLFDTGRGTPGEPIPPYSRECIKEECAWWDEDSSACAIWSLMSGLDALGKVLREIVEKMPKGGRYDIKRSSSKG